MDDWKQDGKRQFIEIGEGDCKLRVEVYPSSAARAPAVSLDKRYRPDEHQWTARWFDANLSAGDDGAKQDSLACIMRLATAIFTRARAGEGYTPLFVAQQAYKAYGDHADWKSWNGLPMPSWEALNDAVRGHWIATCAALIQLLGHGVTAIRNDDELSAALKNVGVDLECAACAAIFYTGVGFPSDEHTCSVAHVFIMKSDGMVPITIPETGEVIGYMKQSAVPKMQQTGFSIGPMTSLVEIQDVDLGATKPE